ncbi:formate dehydrogenase subunit alpha [Catelliglobosispora koreensis]|uniref:formate dehydrogenase subunit alpha n=1 Tax=Catelliglobosispora koreensis TaxID=129052 RepID=UPI0003797A30|nr:formate dehydrogenase subunit alpha [Catelliglobosispora koreensis]
MKLTVDGKPVTVPDGASILDAVRIAGHDVATVCHDDRLKPTGACRVCLVKTDQQGVVAACVTRASEALNISTADTQTVALVRQTLELMVSRLPASALGMPTELARACRKLGVTTAGTARGQGVDETHPYVHLDRDLCVACGRCVRMCDEVQGTFALTLAGRGAHAVVAPGPGSWAQSDCVACGACVDSCPSGALTSPGSLDEASRVVTTTCGYCGVGCSVDVHLGGNGITQITPHRNGPVNRGHACVKGRFAFGFVTSPDRLTTPLIRRDGSLRPASWDEAIAYTAQRLRQIIADHGPDSVAVISSARATNEENYLMQKLARVAIGTNNIDNCSRICHAPSAAGLTASFGLAGGTNAAEDIDKADCFLIVGANPTEAHPVIGARIKQRVLAGAKLVVIDPRRTELARMADVHVRCAPGDNVAVFNGLAHLLWENGWIDREFLETRAEGLEELCELLSAYPEKELPTGELERAAQLYGTAAFPMIFYGLGVTEHAHGTDGVRTLANLAILRGAVGTASGGGANPLRGQNNVQGASDMGALPDLLPGYQPVADAQLRAAVESCWGSSIPATPGLRIPQMFDAAMAGQLKALWVFGENILQTDPDAGHVRAALNACDLVISQEIFLSDTAAVADVVLPGASFLEKDGTFVNFDRRFQRVRPALASAHTDFDVIHAMAAALGADLGCRTPADAMDECARIAPLFRGVSHARLDHEGALHWPCPHPEAAGEAQLYRDRFATPTGRARLAARPWLPPGEQPSAEFPFTLITGRRLVHYNAGTMTRRTPNLGLLSGETIDIHPSDGAKLGITDGTIVRISSRRGIVWVPARLTDQVAPGQVFMAFHFPDVATNLLTSDCRDEVTSCPEFKVTAVSLEGDLA